MNASLTFPPCPFCGSTPRYLPHKTGFYTERVICDSCGFHLPPEKWSLRAPTSDVRPLSECTEADLVEGHAFVFGRCKVWVADPTQPDGKRWCWSKTTWWKALWYPHRGLPSSSGAWMVYGSSPIAFIEVGDMVLTHFMRLPPEPNEELE